MQRFLWCALIGIVIGCGDDDDNEGPDPNANEAGADAAVTDAAVADAAVTASSPAKAANKICETMSGCTDGGRSVSMSDCVQQKTARFTYGVGSGCYSCLTELSCQGWQAIDDGKFGECELCPDCCEPVDAGSSSTPECEPGQASTPGSATDPCPQNDPVCPASMYMAVAACDASGRWQRDTAGFIQCACVLAAR